MKKLIVLAMFFGCVVAANGDSNRSSELRFTINAKVTETKELGAKGWFVVNMPMEVSVFPDGGLHSSIPAGTKVKLHLRAFRAYQGNGRLNVIASGELEE